MGDSRKKARKALKKEMGEINLVLFYDFRTFLRLKFLDFKISLDRIVFR